MFFEYLLSAYTVHSTIFGTVLGFKALQEIYNQGGATKYMYIHK